MQNSEIEYVKKIAQIENLIAKKAKVYSRLLTDTALAEIMTKIAQNREENSSAWLSLITSQSLDCEQKNDERGGQDEV